MALSFTKLEGELILRSNFSQALGEAVLDLGVLRKAVEETAAKAKQIGTVWTTHVTLPILSGAAAVGKSAISYESAFAGVRKTVNATEAEFAFLSKGIRQMSREIPAAATEIAGVTEAAGQLGIQKEHLLGFTRTMTDLGETTNLQSREAAMSLARLANITNMNQAHFGRLGSTVVDLGNNFATTEAEIVEFGLRISAAGNIAGLSQAEILGFGTAVSSVGVQAEAGGTAISKMFSMIYEAVQSGGGQLEEFAKVAGMSADAFVQKYRVDAAGAIIEFVKGLGEMQKRGENVFAVLRDVEFNDERMKRAILSTAGAGELLEKAVRRGTQAWQENTALQKEAAQRYATLASILTVLWNRVKDVGVTLGNTLYPALKLGTVAAGLLLTAIEMLAHAYAALPWPIHLVVGAVALLVAGIGPLLLAFGFLVSSALTIGGTFTALRMAFQMFTGSIVTVPAMVRLLAVGLDTLASVTLTNGRVVFSFASTLDKAAEAATRWARAMKAAGLAGMMAALQIKLPGLPGAGLARDAGLAISGGQAAAVGALAGVTRLLPAAPRLSPELSTMSAAIAATGPMAANAGASFAPYLGALKDAQRETTILGQVTRATLGQAVPSATVAAATTTGVLGGAIAGLGARATDASTKLRAMGTGAAVSLRAWTTSAVTVGDVLAGLSTKSSATTAAAAQSFRTLATRVTASAASMKAALAGAVTGWAVSAQGDVSIFSRSLQTLETRANAMATGIASGFGSFVGTMLKDAKGLGNILTTLVVGAFNLVWAGALKVGGALLWLGQSLLVVAQFIGWPRLLAAGILYLLSLIPGMRGLLGDVVAILALWARIVVDQLVTGLKALAAWLTDTGSAVGKWAKEWVLSIPGMATVVAWWNKGTGAVRAYREELEKRVNSEKAAQSKLAAGYAVSPTVLRNQVNDLGLDVGRLVSSGADRGEFGQARLRVLVEELEKLRAKGAQIPPVLQQIIDKFRGVNGAKPPSMKPFLEQIKEADRKLDELFTPRTLAVEITGLPFMSGGTLPIPGAKPLATWAPPPAPPSREDMADIREAYIRYGDTLGEENIRTRLKSLSTTFNDDLVWARQKERWDNEKKGIEEAADKAKEYADRIRDLANELSGLAAVEKARETMAALGANRSKGLTLAMMPPDQREALNKSLAEGIAGYRALGQAVPIQTFIAFNQTQIAHRGLLANTQKDVDETTKALTGMKVALRAWGDELRAKNFDKLSAELTRLDAAWAANQQAIRESARATEDYILQANRLPFDTLQGRMAAITREFDRKRKAIDETQKRHWSYVQLEAQWAKEEAARRQVAFREWADALPMTAKMQRALKQLEIDSAKATLALALSLGSYARLFGFTEEVIERLRLKIRQLEGEARGDGLRRWASALREIAGIVHQVADAFDNAFGRILNKIAQVIDAVGTLVAALATPGMFDDIAAAVNLGIKVFDAIFDIGPTEYEQNARAARDQFKTIREELVRTHGDVATLQRMAERAGLTMPRLAWDPNGDAFQQLEQMQTFATELTATLERIAKGLESFAAGAKTRIDAFAKAFNLDKIKDLRKELEEHAARPVYDDAGTRVYSDREREIERELERLSPMNALGGDEQAVREEYSRMGLYAGTAFIQTLREHGLSKALEVAGPMFDQLDEIKQAFGSLGLELSGAAEKIGAFYKVAKDNADVVQALDGLSGMIRGASDALFLDQELMDAFSTDAAGLFTRLTERGVDANQALVLMQPTLQALWEAQDKFGLEVDETTQGLIDQAKKQGIVGAHARDVNLRILAVLEAIHDALLSDIPDAMDEFGRRAKSAAGEAEGAFRRIPRRVEVEVATRHTSTGTPDYLDPDYDPNHTSDGLPGSETLDPDRLSTGGIVQPRYLDTGGIVGKVLQFPTAATMRPPAYFDGGGRVVAFTPKGTDTVPAMLTPGEVVFNEAQSGQLAHTLAHARALADGLRAGRPGGGDDASPTEVHHHTHVHQWTAVDGPSVRRFVEGKEFGESFARVATSNSHNVKTAIRRAAS